MKKLSKNFYLNYGGLNFKYISSEIYITQSPDTLDPGNDDQVLRVGVVDDNLNDFIYLKTDRWALDWDEIDDFCEFLQNLKTLKINKKDKCGEKEKEETQEIKRPVDT